MPAPQPLDPVGVLAKSKTVLDKPRSARSLEEEFGMDPGVATTKPEYTKVFNGGGSEGEGLRRLDGHAQVDRILCRHGHPGETMAALEARVREDRTTLPEESGSWERPAEEYALHHCAHLRGFRGVIVMVTGDLDEGRIGGFARQHALLCQIYGMLESVDRPTPKPDQTSTGCPPKLPQPSHDTGKEVTQGIDPCSGCPSPALDQTSLW